MPEYNLEQIKKAVRKDKIQYYGRRVSIDTANLGYTFEDVCKCLLTLKTSDYHETIQYSQDPVFDVYLVNYLRAECIDDIDRLYIKLAYIEAVVIASFHLQRQ